MAIYKYYGAALADAAPDTARPEDYKPGGTAVARDLAFYPTPAEAVAILLDGLPVKPGFLMRPEASALLRCSVDKPNLTLTSSYFSLSPGTESTSS